jgi:hypothetical protein
MSRIHVQSNPIHGLLQGLAISGAIKYAVEQINNCSSVRPGVQLDFLYNDTQVLFSYDAMVEEPIGTLGQLNRHVTQHSYQPNLEGHEKINLLNSVSKCVNILLSTELTHFLL